MILVSSLQILNIISEDHLGFKGNFRSPLEQAEFIRDLYHGEPSCTIFISSSWTAQHTAITEASVENGFDDRDVTEYMNG